MEINSEKYYIVRANGAGVLFGRVAARRGNEVDMEDVRKLHYWDGAGAVEQLALDGTSKPGNCRFTVTVPSMTVFNALQLIECSPTAVKSIKGVKEWKR